MCGIAGIIKEGNGEGIASALRCMTDAIAHRGPDDDGHYLVTTANGRYSVALGHRRLSIIDVAGGHQPQRNEDGTVHVVFNGEIYNFPELRNELLGCGHVFTTNSDTEVIVHAYEEYGDACVNRFRGMFAFAVWDAKRERLILARDRFGKKPLFIAEQKGVLVFGSEIKALLASPWVRPTVNMRAVWDYLAYRYVPGPQTLFHDVRKIEPGTVAIWERGHLTMHRYYTPPDGVGRVSYEVPRDPVAGFLRQMDEAVRIRMISDVPFGAFLSGGVDSSAIVGLMARHSEKPIRTFSVGFAESKFSELKYAREVAEWFGTDHHELVVREQDIIDRLPQLIRFRDAPISEPSDIPIYLLAREARHHVKMVLTGEGSDEILAGYPKHRFEVFASIYQKLPASWHTRVIEPLTHALPYQYHRAKTAIGALGTRNPDERYARWFGALSMHDRATLAAFEFSEAETANSGGGHERNTALRRLLYFDQVSWLPDNLLERGDRMTMAASIEARMPFMDHELVAFISALPDRYRLRWNGNKWLLRQAMKQLLPKRILKRPKVGFRVPVNEWFRGNMREYLADHLLSQTALTRDLFRREVLERIVTEHIGGSQNHEKLLWSLLNLELWYRAYAGEGGSTRTAMFEASSTTNYRQIQATI